MRESLLASGLLLKGHLEPASPVSGWLADADAPWAEVPRILARISPPLFPARDFRVERFGAVADNQTDCTEAFEQAITASQAAGGGRVVVPAGQYLTGAIRLKSNVNLHVEEGAVIRFFRDPRKYPLVGTRWEGVELMNFSPLLYAFEEENIALTGKGTIDGSADAGHWWPWKGGTDGQPNQIRDRARLFEMSEEGVPVGERIFGEGHYLRPPLLQPYRCKNVLIEGVSLCNSPMWHVHPVLCRNVIVRGLAIRSSGPNTDGCDPESCTDVLIEDCFFDTGDDCIAIKSGRNADGRRLNVPSQNIVVRNCRMRDGHGGVTIGSEISGGVRDVFVENCRMDSPHLEFALRVKNNASRGGVLENIFARDIDVGEVRRAAVSVDFYYEEGEAGKFTPRTRNLEILRMTAHKARYALYLRGFKNAPIRDVRLSDCQFDGVLESSVVENAENVVLHNVRVNGKLISPKA